MLFFRVHLAEADVVAMRLEDRIIAETPVPARRPDDGAVDAALERLHMAVGPGEGKRADEMRAVARFRPLRLDIVPDQPPGDAEIIGRAGTTSGQDDPIAV